MLTPEIKTNLILKEIGIQRYSLRSQGKIISQKTYHYFLKGKILAIFDPTTLPRAKPDDTLNVAFIATINSGADVPKDTTVSDTSKAETPNLLLS